MDSHFVYLTCNRKSLVTRYRKTGRVIFFCFRMFVVRTVVCYEYKAVKVVGLPNRNTTTIEFKMLIHN